MSLPRGRAALVGVLVSAVLVGACQKTPVRPTAPPPAAPTTAAAPAATAGSAGCGPGGAGAGAVVETLETITVEGQTRHYRLDVRATAGPAARHPLILLFHGSGSDAAEIAELTHLPRRAAARGYVVATPDAVNHNWQVSLPTARTADLDFVSALMTAISARVCIDSHRIYAAGFSLGSEFAAITACAPTASVVAIGLVAAEFLLKPCARPVSVIAFHGTADPAVPYQDGAIGVSLPGIPVRGVEKNLGDWGALDGCVAAPLVAPRASTAVRRTWPACAPGTDVVLYTILGGGHAWPGPPLDATGRILDFFDQHPITPAGPPR
jgi:polyhydroxybutyrate depolymerase